MNTPTYPKNKIELPTVGRIVLFYDYGAVEPLPAVVVRAMDLNADLCVLGRGGRSEDPNVTLPASMTFDVCHESTRPTKSTSHWDWMPYQKSQAAKTEALQRELDHAATKARNDATKVQDPVAARIDEMKASHKEDPEAEDRAAADAIRKSLGENPS